MNFFTFQLILILNHKVSETIDPGADICKLESRHHNNVSCHFDIFLHCIYYVDYEKKVLNSDTDSKQFHQYQKNKTITFHLKSLNIKRPSHVMLEIQILAWDRHKDMTGLNWLMGSQSSLLIMGYPRQCLEFGVYKCILFITTTMLCEFIMRL